MTTVDSKGAEGVELLFRQHYAWLLDFLSRRLGSQASEDAAQEAFARTLVSGSAIRNPRAFLATVALRAVADQRRRDARMPATSEVHEPDAPALPVQLESILLEQLLRGLPRPIRETYLLCRVAGMSYPEAAERLGVSVKRVEARMTEAHKRFAALMRD